MQRANRYLWLCYPGRNTLLWLACMQGGISATPVQLKLLNEQIFCKAWDRSQSLPIAALQELTGVQPRRTSQADFVSGQWVLADICHVTAGCTGWQQPWQSRGGSQSPLLGAYPQLLGQAAPANREHFSSALYLPEDFAFGLQQLRGRLLSCLEKRRGREKKYFVFTW